MVTAQKSTVKWLLAPYYTHVLIGHTNELILYIGHISSYFFLPNLIKEINISVELIFPFFTAACFQPRSNMPIYAFFAVAVSTADNCLTIFDYNKSHVYLYLFTKFIRC